MENSTYVKGNKEEVIKRFSQIHSVTLRCPINDDGVIFLRSRMITSFGSYLDGNGKFNKIPVSDFVNAFMNTLNFCKSKKVSVKMLYIIIGCIQGFKNLKYISVEFTDDADVLKAYNDIQNKDNTDNEKVKMLKSIYDINVLEFNLSDMFSQEVIDFFNKCMMHNGLMSNSYLKREFYIDFDYDGYVAFMDMFLGNNGITFEEMDKNIIEYFRMLPVFIADQKPSILVITNYSDL